MDVKYESIKPFFPLCLVKYLHHIKARVYFTLKALVTLCFSN